MMKGYIFGTMLVVGVFALPSVAADGPTDTPSPPRDLTAVYSPTSGEVVLTWDEPAFSGDSPVSEYHVYKDGAYLDETLNLEYHDSIVAMEAIYTVVAVNSQGSSVSSAPASPFYGSGGCLVTNTSSFPPTAGIDPGCINPFKQFLCQHTPPPAQSTVCGLTSNAQGAFMQLYNAIDGDEPLEYPVDPNIPLLEEAYGQAYDATNVI